MPITARVLLPENKEVFYECVSIIPTNLRTILKSNPKDKENDVWL